MIKKSHCKTLGLLVLMVALFSGSVLYFGIIKKSLGPSIAEIKIEGTILPKAQPIAEFHSFTNHRGQAFTKNNLLGHWTFLFFGFTNCGYVCPTTMAELNQMYKLLQAQLPDRALPQVVFVSVDPDRDSLKKLGRYVSAFNPNFIGIRSDETNTERFENQLHITAIKMQPEGAPSNQYSVDHSSEILLINPQGAVQAYFNFPPKAEELAKDYQLILRMSK